MSNPQLGDPNGIQKASAAIKAIADIEAAKVKAEGEKIATAVKDQADSAREDRREDAKVASDVRKYDFYRVVLVALIMAAPATIAAWRSGNIEKKVETYSKQVDGMKDELVTEVRKNAFNAGKAAEKAVEKGVDEMKGGAH